MTTHLGLQRILLPSAQVSQLTTGSITLPSARTAFIPPTSYESIATVYLSSAGASTVDFTNIPQTFAHLELRYSAWTDRTSNHLDDVRFNFGNSSIDTGGNYNYRAFGIEGIGGGAFAVQVTGGGTYMQSGLCVGGASYPNGIGIFTIPNYTSTNIFKSLHGPTGFTTNSGSNTNRYGMFQGGWASTSAITHIRLTVANSNWARYSHFALYGLKES
jgi:hypothetical protein